MLTASERKRAFRGDCDPGTTVKLRPIVINNQLSWSPEEVVRILWALVMGNR